MSDKTPQELGLESAIRLLRIEIAELNVKYHYAEYNYHSIQLDRWKELRLKANYLSQKGIDPDEWKKGFTP